MEGRHPKRRKDKYNPYTICEKEGHYYISFTDGEKRRQKLELDKEVYDLFNAFELEDLRYLNVSDRHIERFELRDECLNQRAFYKADDMEEAIYKRLLYQQLHHAITILPVTQKRRLEFYFFREMTYEQIASLEGCSKVAVKYTIDKAIKRLKQMIE